jgi:hypothetical protein
MREWGTVTAMAMNDPAKLDTIRSKRDQKMKLSQDAEQWDLSKWWEDG